MTATNGPSQPGSDRRADQIYDVVLRRGAALDRSVVDSCSGPKCGSNAGLNTPTLPYGRSTGAGPFRCVSLTRGMICTGSGRGFMISTAGVVTCTGHAASGTLTVCPGSGPVGTTITVTGQGCSATSVTFGGAAVAVAPGGGDDFAGTWTIPATPGDHATFRTDGRGCSAPFHLTAGRS